MNIIFPSLEPKHGSPRILSDILLEMSQEPGSILAAYRGMFENENEHRREITTERKGGDG